jgi:hypothetical protein
MSTLTKPVRRRAGATAISALLVVGASAAALGATADSAGADQAAGARLEARLRPGGDPNGFGEAKFILYKARHRVCATVEWHRIGTPNAAHIHRRSDGMIVVDLSGSVTGGSHCARHVSSALIGRILAHPRHYYFNVHNARYPAGAIQGRLHH